jgi:hypothetical protein
VAGHGVRRIVYTFALIFRFEVRMLKWHHICAVKLKRLQGNCEGPVPSKMKSRLATDILPLAPLAPGQCVIGSLSGILIESRKPDGMPSDEPIRLWLNNLYFRGDTSPNFHMLMHAFGAAPKRSAAYITQCRFEMPYSKAVASRTTGLSSLIPLFAQGAFPSKSFVVVFCAHA